MIVRNLFIDCDHAALVKDQSWIHVENNTLINCSVGINFDEPAEGGIDPGVGAYLEYILERGNAFGPVLCGSSDMGDDGYYAESQYHTQFVAFVRRGQYRRESFVRR